MRVFNKDKTTELLEYDLEQGHLVSDKLFIAHHDAEPAIPSVTHTEVIKTHYNNDGTIKGQSLKEVVDSPAIPAKKAWDEYENIQVYIPFTNDELLDHLRKERERVCFPVINRGQLWYDTLTSDQLQELNVWYQAWLDVTETKVKPTAPQWL